jgi:hypothetical protein
MVLKPLYDFLKKNKGSILRIIKAAKPRETEYRTKGHYLKPH